MPRIPRPRLPRAVTRLATAALALVALTAGTTKSCDAQASPGKVRGYDREQLRNAGTIVRACRAEGLPRRGQVVAVAAAMQESGLRNLSGGPGSSVGLFQQLDNGAWGSYASRHDPERASRSFCRALKKVRGWQSMSIGGAAQAVQRSAFPGAYAKHRTSADRLVSAVG